jgi:hypothetical protein
MLNSKPALALLAAGLLLIGYGLGQFLAAPSPGAPPRVAECPPAPKSPAPVYEGDRPHAVFPEQPAASPAGEGAQPGAVTKALSEPTRGRRVWPRCFRRWEPNRSTRWRACWTTSRGI